MKTILFALFIWMPVATDKQGSPVNGWVYQTDFTSEAKCVAAALRLGMRHSDLRCVEK